MYSTHSRKKRKKRRSATSTLPGNGTKSHKAFDSKGSHNKETQIIHGSGNVFDDVGFAPEEAANLKVRADLMLDLRRYIDARGWTQSEAAAFFAETQPRISNLMKGEISRFSIDKLIKMLALAGIQVQIKTQPKAA